MIQHEERREALRERRRQRLQRRLLLHIGVSAVVLLLLFSLNLATGGPFWSLWVGAFWGGMMLLRIANYLVARGDWPDGRRSHSLSR